MEPGHVTGDMFRDNGPSSLATTSYVTWKDDLGSHCSAFEVVDLLGSVVRLMGLVNDQLYNAI